MHVPASTESRAQVLNSWKEIAVYLGRGVRTVQRYERSLHLPVHRLGNKLRSSVMAFPGELDSWLQETSRDESAGDKLVPHPDSMQQNLSALRESILESSKIREEVRHARVAHHERMNALIMTIRRMTPNTDYE